MSQRSIVEINHDFSHRIASAPQGRIEHLLLRALGSGSEENWKPLEAFGIRRVTQCHHSEDRRVVVGNGVLQREYEIP